MRPPRPLVPDAVRVLRPLVEADVLEAAEVALADAVVRHADATDVDDRVILALAVAGLGRRLGHVCVDLGAAAALAAAATAGNDAVQGARVGEGGLAFPDVAAWTEVLAASPLVELDPPAGEQLRGDRPLVLAGGRIYLSRYAGYERAVFDELVARSAGDHDETDVDAVLTDVFGPGAAADPQRAAVRVALTRPLSVVVGGPGTGKTWTVGRLHDAVERLDETRPEPWRVALAAPTGKAASRLTAAVDGRSVATTVHRLLGTHPGKPAGIDRSLHLPHDLVVVDEASMVDLPLMAKLLAAVRPDAHLVFVGDPDQLASVEVGSVLRDVVDSVRHGSDTTVHPLDGTVAVLDRVHRFDAGSGIADLADAVRLGDLDGALAVLARGDGVTLVDPADEGAFAPLRAEVVDAARALVAAGRDNRPEDAFAAALEVKVLAATRRGPLGLRGWNDRIAAGVDLPSGAGTWTPGRPVLVTENDPRNGVDNGDTGVVVPGSTGPLVAFPGVDGPRLLRPSRLRAHEDWWAMTIHKSQGSEFEHVVVSLPTEDSPILTRELLYTAVTRARSRVTVLATEAVVRAAIERPVARASGLRERLEAQASAAAGTP
jgi:exodeoxyribonuclease V alpha subunit